MKKNFDSKQVVIDKDFLELLMAFAEKHAKGNHFEKDLKRVKRHIRKFNPLSLETSKQIQKDIDVKVAAPQLRKMMKRARRLVSEKFTNSTILVNGKPEAVTPYLRHYWYFDPNRKLAWPVYVHKQRKDYGVLAVECSFIIAEHREEAVYKYSLDMKEILNVDRIVESREELPEGTDVREIPAPMDLLKKKQEETECCDSPCLTFDGKCENCEDDDLKPCCDNEDRNYNGWCKNCGDPCL